MNNKLKPTEINYIISHGSCPDGFGAAWSAWKLLGESAEYHFAGHEDVAPDVVGKNVAILDFCYPKDILEEMAKKANRIIVLDHHIKNQEKVEGFSAPNVELIFDMNRSGAMMAWEFFHEDKVRPWIIKYIQDRDLWKWKLPQSQEYLAAIDSYDWTFEIFEELSKKSLPTIILEGTHIIKYFNKLVNESVRGATKGTLKTCEGDVKVWFVNNASKEFSSEIGHILAKKDKDRDVAAIWHYSNDNEGFRVSLRSVKTNVADIAARFGGGGHAQAAGFFIKGQNISNLFCHEK